MGNTPTCVDCFRDVPKTVRFFDKIPFFNGRKIYGFFTDEYWTKLSSNQYLCPYCLIKRQESERQEEENRQRENQRRAREAEKRRIEAQRREFERQQRLEAEKKRIENERREKEKQRIEEQIREYNRQLIEIQRRANEKRRIEEQRREKERQRIEEQRQEKERQHIEEQRREKERQRIEEQRREKERQRIEEQRREKERQRIIEQRREEERQRIEEQRREKERQRIAEQRREKERQRIEEQRREKERQRIEEQRREKERQRIEEQRREEERQRIEEQRREVERQHIEELRREKERQRIEEQRQEEERQRIEEQRREKERQRIEEQRREEERQRIEEQRQEEERQLIEEHRREKERQHIEEQRREKERQRIEEQRREEERQRIEEQRREEERQLIEEQRREKERQHIEEQRREKERQRIEEQRRDEERQLIEEQKQNLDANESVQQATKTIQNSKTLDNEVRHKTADIDSWIRKQKTVEDEKCRVLQAKLINIKLNEHSLKLSQPKENKSIVMKKQLLLRVKQNPCMYIKLPWIYRFLIQNFGKYKCNEMICYNLFELLHSFLYDIISLCEPEENKRLSSSDVIFYILKKTDYNSVQVYLFALVCVFMEMTNINDEDKLIVYAQYRNRQGRYEKNELTLTVLLRKICDALAVLLCDSNLSDASHLIKTFLDDMYEKLLTTCIPESGIKRSLAYLKNDLSWNTEDLLYLLWHVANHKEIALSKLKEIKLYHDKWDCDFILRHLFPREKVGNVELENRAKNVEQIVQEMEMQKSKDCTLQSSRLLKVWTSVSRKLTKYGYPRQQIRPWETRKVDLSMFQGMGSVVDTDIKLDDVLSNCIAEIFLGVYNAKRFWPRITQYTSLFYLIEAVEKGQLLEINTGEGKTCIIAMFAVYLAMANKYVDIVSSSAVLAQRDSDEWKCFYDLFKLSSGSNLTQTKKDERLESYGKRIIYGTVSSFASDILRQEFLLEDTRGSRRFDAVIVDEVDCLLLDNGVNFTYLSSEAPGMHHIEPILLMIWTEIVRHPMMKTSTGDAMFLGKPEPVPVLLAKLFPELPDSEDRPKPLQILYMLEHAGILREDFTVDFMKQNPFDKKNENCIKGELNKPVILNCLRFAEQKSDYVFQVFQISDENNIQMLNSVDNDSITNTIQLLVVGEGLVCRLYPDKEQLFALIQEKINGYIQGNEDSQQIAYEIPSYLLEFVNNRMSQWIENAFLAKCMTPGREYIVKDKDIVPVDFESTGVVELDTKWGDGLHQFLEVKHNKKLSPMTLVTNFMSNQAFFKRYPRKIYGVSGTLGGDVELLYLLNNFELTCLKIPTHLQKKFVESPGLVCSCKVEWIECIQKVVHEHVSGKYKRAVLVVCEDINTAEEISKAVQTGNESNVSLLTRNDQEDNTLDKKFIGGDVIVATNIAGRGTDVEIGDDVIRAGGLVVLVTFLPKNERVENQVFGRSARKGHPGSAQIILNKGSLPLCLQGFSNIEDLKSIRDDIEGERMKDLQGKLLKETEKKENLFNIYCKFIQENTEMLRKDSTQFNIVLSSLHEFWGLWLKMNCEHIGSERAYDEIKHKLESALPQARQKVIETNSPTANLYHIIHFANKCLADKDYDQCIHLYCRAINNDSKWAAVAFYNRAYCQVLQRKPGYIRNAICDLHRAKESFGNYKNEVVLAISLLCFVNQKATEEIDNDIGGTISQFNTRCQILNFIESNIDTAIQSLADLENAKKNARAVGASIFTITFGDDRLCKKIDSELHIFWELGLTEIVTMEERPAFSWKGLLVVALGVLQIAVGTLAIACSSGLLSQIGWGFVGEGINDICTGVYAIYKNDQTFLEGWLKGKAMSIAISIASLGFNHIKAAVQGTNSIKSAIEAIGKTFESGMKEIVSSCKEIPSKISSACFKTALQETCKEVAVHTTKTLAERGSKYLLQTVNNKLKEYFEKEARRQVKDVLKKEMRSGKFKDMLAKFIVIEKKTNGEKQTNEDKEGIAEKYMKITENVLTNKNFRQFTQILLGCVKDVLSSTKNAMIKDDLGIFQQVGPIFDVIFESAKRSSYDVKQMVDIYCEHIMKAFTEIYSESLNAISDETIDQHQELISEVSTILEERVSEHLFKLIQTSFTSTGDSLLSQKLGSIVFQTVSNFKTEHGIGQDAIQSVLSISTKGEQIVECVKEFKITNIVNDELANSILTTAEDGISILGFKTAGFALKAAKDGSSALQSGNLETVVITALDLTKGGFDTFADEKTKKVAEMAFTVVKDGGSALQSGNLETVVSTALKLTKEGFDTFADEKTKKLAEMACNVAEDGGSALQSGNLETVVSTALKLTKEGFDTFADEKTKKVAEMAFNVAKDGDSALQSGNLETVVSTALKLTKEGFDTFADEKTKKLEEMACNVAKDRGSALQSGNLETVVSTALKLTKEGFDTFADEKTKKLAEMACNVAKNGDSALQSGNLKTVVSTALKLTKEGFDTFADEKTKKLAEMACNVAKNGDSALQSGNLKTVVSTALKLTKEGFDTFADEKTKKVAEMAFNVAKDGGSALQSVNLETVVSTALDLTKEGFDKFADEETEKIAELALTATKQGVNALQSGNLKKIISTAVDLTNEGVNTF